MTEIVAPKPYIYVFEHLDNHIKWLSRLLIILAVMSAIAVVTGYVEHVILVEISAGGGGDSLVARAEASDFSQLVIGWCQMLISILTVITFAYWIIRACRNVHAMSKSESKLSFSPAWSVGWYCIPIANLWKPYQAMRQIWNISEDASSNPDRPGSSLLALWWFVFLVDSTIGRVAFKYALKAETLDQLLTSNVITMISDGFGIVAIIVALKLITTIQSFQSKYVP